MIDNLRVFFQSDDLGYTDPFGQRTSSWDTGYGGGQQQGGLGSAGFYMPKGGTGQSYSPYGMSTTGQGIQNYMQGQGSLSGLSQGQMPYGLQNFPTGTYDQSMLQYLMQGGLAQQQQALGQSGISQGISNLLGLGNQFGVPTDMNAGMRQIGDIAQASGGVENKQMLQDTLSALQGQRGTGAGLGSNIDQMMGQALGASSAGARDKGLTAELSYMQNFLPMIANAIRQLSPGK